MWDVLTESKVLGSGGTFTTERFKLYDRRWHHAVQYEVIGSGALDLSFYTSVDGKNWIDNGIKIAKVTATHGPGGNGKDIVPVQLKPGEFFKAEFTVSTATLTTTAWFVQK